MVKNGVNLSGWGVHFFVRTLYSFVVMKNLGRVSNVPVYHFGNARDTIVNEAYIRHFSVVFRDTE